MIAGLGWGGGGSGACGFCVFELESCCCGCGSCCLGDRGSGCPTVSKSPGYWGITTVTGNGAGGRLDSWACHCNLVPYVCWLCCVHEARNACPLLLMGSPVLQVLPTGRRSWIVEFWCCYCFFYLLLGCGVGAALQFPCCYCVCWLLAPSQSFSPFCSLRRSSMATFRCTNV